MPFVVFIHVVLFDEGDAFRYNASALRTNSISFHTSHKQVTWCAFSPMRDLDQKFLYALIAIAESFQYSTYLNRKHKQNINGRMIKNACGDIYSQLFVDI